jgi:hypothetical protein
MFVFRIVVSLAMACPMSKNVARLDTRTLLSEEGSVLIDTNFVYYPF